MIRFIGDIQEGIKMNKVFLLEPIKNPNFPAVLIFIENEENARENACVSYPGNNKTTGGVIGSNAISPTELTFYESNKNASCRQLKPGEDYEIIPSSDSENEIGIIYKGCPVSLFNKPSNCERAYSYDTFKTVRYCGL